jgi:ArsR family transcriptional regulator
MYQKLFAMQEEVFKVLANQKRLEIIQLLDGRELSVSQMIEMLGLPQANLSQHLSLLRQAKIVSHRRDGHTIYYRLEDPRISQACNMIKDVLRHGNGLTEEEHVLMDNQEGMYPIVKDPVCGMRISVSRAGDYLEIDGSTYYFCASGCKEAFASQPQKYVKKEQTHG